MLSICEKNLFRIDLKYSISAERDTKTRTRSLFLIPKISGIHCKMAESLFFVLDAVVTLLFFLIFCCCWVCVRVSNTRQREDFEMNIRKKITILLNFFIHYH